MKLPTKQEIQSEATKEKSMNSENGFIRGAEWMEQQLEPIITEYGMNEIKLRSMLEELLGDLEDEVLSSSITDTLKRAHQLLDK